MCEYDPGCPKSDLPLAVHLWTHPEQVADPRTTILCRKNDHRLAVVLDMAGSPVLLTPHNKFLARALYEDAADDFTTEAHNHAGLTPVDDLEGYDLGRCHCGTWSYTADRVRRAVERGEPVLYANYVALANSGRNTD